MKTMDVNDIKKCGFEILIEIHNFCEKNNIKYSLGFGTLLGAIRHKGFIPWDDDVDVLMLREDYERFIKTFNSDNYGVNACNIDNKYYLPFAKVYDKRTIKIEPVYTPNGFEIGVNVDIFPIDYFNDEERYKKIVKKRKGLRRKFFFSQFLIKKPKCFKDFIKNIIAPFYNKKNNKYANMLNNYIRKNNKNKNDKRILVHNEIFNNRPYIFPITLFDSLIKVEFEGREFYSIKDYDIYLKVCYGDYMKLPPEEQRITHHNFEAYIK